MKMGNEPMEVETPVPFILRLRRGAAGEGYINLNAAVAKVEDIEVVQVLGVVLRDCVGKYIVFCYPSLSMSCTLSGLTMVILLGLATEGGMGNRTNDDNDTDYNTDSSEHGNVSGSYLPLDTIPAPSSASASDSEIEQTRTTPTSESEDSVGGRDR